MIANIKGIIISKHPRCVVSVGGVGLELTVPRKDLEHLEEGKGEVAFFTYLHVREDRLSLYGFLREEDRELFTRLLEVSGVGPKLALGILSLHAAEKIVSAIRGGDLSFLLTLPGLGRRTGERLVMELKGKLEDLPKIPGRVIAGASVREEAVMALVSLGMARGAAEEALGRVNWNEWGDMTIEDVVKEALKQAGPL